MSHTNSPLKPIALTNSPSRYQRIKSYRIKLSRSTPELKSAFRFIFGRQSSLAPSDRSQDDLELPEVGPAHVEAGFKFFCQANEGDLDGIRETLDSGVDIHFKDLDGRTALHVASCQGQTAVAQFLLDRGAEVDSTDNWGSTPLADAIHYEHQDVVELLEKYGAKPPVAPMRLPPEHDVPEYEIFPKDMDLTASFRITKGTFCVGMWQGTPVAVKTLPDHFTLDGDKIGAFRDELALLQKLRHPNIVQFLGAVTQSSPMTIVTEYLPKGDLRAFLDRKGALKTSTAVKFALDIARGLNYLHQLPEPIIHRDLEPSNILRCEAVNLKVADFGLSKLQMAANTPRGDRTMAFQDFSWRYMAPEVFRNEEYDTKVDVFSFALIFQEMIEGRPPFPSMLDRDVPKVYCDGRRPPFNASEKKYPYGLKLLIQQCWNANPSERPKFIEIVKILQEIVEKLERRKKYMLHIALCGCFSRKNRQEIDNIPPSTRASVSIIR